MFSKKGDNMPVIRTQYRNTSVKRNIIEADKVTLGPAKTEIDVVGIREVPMEGNEERSRLVFDVLYKVDYELKEPKDQNFGTVEINIDVWFLDEISVTKKILENWENDKKVDVKLLAEILNWGIKAGASEAMTQSYKTGLPLPLRVPKAQTGPTSETPQTSSAG